MADKKAILVDASGMSLVGTGDALDKLNKKAAVLTNADRGGLVASKIGRASCRERV